VTKAAAVAPSPGGSSLEGEGLVQDRIARLEDLNRLKRAVAVWDAERVIPIFSRAPTPAAALVCEIGECLARVGVYATDCDKSRRPSIVRRDTVWEGGS